MNLMAQKLIDWQRRHGRNDLPWQMRDAYAVWVSEIMLQQTQVETVIPYYQRFMARFPDLQTLAQSDLDAVLALWSGLGYYARARNLHRAARLAWEGNGHFPEHFDALLALPGIGRSTAGAIAVFAGGGRYPILDGNVRRVLARISGIEGLTGDAVVQSALWRQAEALLPECDMAAYTQGLMDLGAMVCTRARPRCEGCPWSVECVARQSGRQHELPVPRPPRSVPERSVDLWLIEAAGRVLLEQRPPLGIWGGLWSLPERSPVGLDAAVAEPLPPYRHALTHFRLLLQPRRIRLDRVPVQVAEPGRQWVTAAQWRTMALPAPIRRLLEASVCVD